MKTHIKNLTTSALLYALIQIAPAMAESAEHNSEHACLAGSVACKSVVAVLNAIDNNAEISTSKKFFDFQMPTQKEIYAETSSAKTHTSCGTQAHKTSTPLSQIIAGLSGGEKFGNVLFAIESSDAKIIPDAKGGVDYDMISQSDVLSCHVDEVPIPTAGWLFASALLGFITFSNKRRA